MVRFFKKLSVYLLFMFIILCAYYFLGAYFGRKVYGVDTEDQIRISFHNANNRIYNKLFLGNSRVYRGINPDCIDNHTYNFAHDNDTFNQCYYKLVYLIDKGHKLDTLFLGADYFQFGIKSHTRNYVYDNLFAEEYYKDYNTNILNENIANLKQIFYNNQLLLPKALIKLIMNKNIIGQIKDNGQYIYDSKASPNDKVTRNTEILDLQVDYYNRIVDLCHSHNIQLTVFTMPVRDGEMESYTREFVSKIQSIIKTPLSIKDRYIDMTYLEDFRDYHDYTDITHLNSSAADRFSIFFKNEIINKQ